MHKFVFCSAFLTCIAGVAATCMSNFTLNVPAGLCLNLSTTASSSQQMKPFDMYEYCWKTGGRLIGITDALRLAPFMPQTFVVAAHDEFIESGQSREVPWLDPEEGLLQIPGHLFGPNQPNMGSPDANQDCMFVDEHRVHDVPCNHLSTMAVCVEGHANVYTNNRLQARFETKYPSFGELTGKKFQTQLNTIRGDDRFVEEKTAVNRCLICLLLCIDDSRCQSVYYSTSRKVCLKRLHIDGPIPFAHNSPPDDWERFKRLS